MRFAAVVVIFLAIGPALAEDAPSPSYSSASLVMMLGAEQACHLTYDKSGIERFMKHITDKKQTVPEIGSLVAFEQEYVVKKMSPSTLIAHCAQVRATAKLYEFIQ